MPEIKYLHSEITKQILQAFYQVYNNLGYCFDKLMYIKAMVTELKVHELRCEAHKNITIFYNAHDLGDIITDIIVESKILIKMETKDKIDLDSGRVLYNYLHASELEVGLLLNFGKMPEQNRKFCASATKQNLS